MVAVSVGLTLHASMYISLSLAPYLKVFAAFYPLEDTKKGFKSKRFLQFVRRHDGT